MGQFPIICLTPATFIKTPWKQYVPGKVKDMKQNAALKLLMGLALASLVASCGIITSGRNEALDTDWVLVRIDAYSKTISADMRPTMTLDEGEVVGNSGVNSFSGTYSWKSDGSFKFDEIAITEMAGTPEQMEIEALLMEALMNTRFYELSDTKLIFSDADGTPLVSFLPSGSPSL